MGKRRNPELELFPDLQVENQSLLMRQLTDGESLIGNERYLGVSVHRLDTDASPGLSVLGFTRFQDRDQTPLDLSFLNWTSHLRVNPFEELVQTLGRIQGAARSFATINSVRFRLRILSALDVRSHH